MPKNEGPVSGRTSSGGGATPYRPANRIQEVTRETTGSEQAERARYERTNAPTPPKTDRR